MQLLATSLVFSSYLTGTNGYNTD